MAATAQPLLLERGSLETMGEEQQQAFQLLRSMPAAPVVQRLTRRGTAPWLVQFNGVLREEWSAALEAEGAVIRGYVPENALLVEASPQAIVRMAASEKVVWVGEYLPVFKLSGGILKMRVADGDTDLYGIQLFDMADKPQLVRDLGELGATVPRAEAFSESRTFRAWLTPPQVNEMATWGSVEWIEAVPSFRTWGSSGPIDKEESESLQATYEQGQRVHLIIRGAADSGTYGAEARALDEFVWAHPEMLVVTAAGNAAADLKPADGIVDAGSIGSPATAKNALSVGAAESRRDVARTWRDSWPEDFAVEPIALDRMAQADGLQGLAAFSGRGPCVDGRTKPELVAPGTFLVALRPADSDFRGWGVAEHTNEIYVGGTGVAAEQVAEAAKQARTWLAEARGMEAPSAALVKALLLAGARDLAPGQYGTGPKQEIPFGRPNSSQGAGLLDLDNALSPGEGKEIELHDASGLAAGATDVYELRARAAGDRFVLVLAYSDRPAAPAAARQLVNDLDLTVTAPDGAVRHANGRKSPDDLNNVEMIEFEADEEGTYLARVKACAVPLGGIQPYALVVRRPQAPAAAAAPSETK